MTPLKRLGPQEAGGPIFKLKDAWHWEDAPALATDHEMNSFELETGLLIPPDMRTFFTSVNGSNGYDDGLFDFYSFDGFMSENEPAPKLYHLPSAVTSNNTPNHCYVFADYQVHLIDYLIQLYQHPTASNDIYIRCGQEIKLMAHSFNEFVSLCLMDSQKLFFND
ncbi:SMI1/KNR4 family protein [Mucilaginibacter sp. CSA2-8R]|uniref:SMI1/KNR4 family protein n=1 Tax=Mucilaginibacter sp. CSA2-8R TaxID=3141542 RepID=UPI00315DE228